MALVLLRDILARRAELKLILMSATLDSAKFSSYFSQAPVVDVPGFTHPITELYLHQVLQKTGFTLPPPRGWKTKQLLLDENGRPTKTLPPAASAIAAAVSEEVKECAAAEVLDDWEETNDSVEPAAIMAPVIASSWLSTSLKPMIEVSDDLLLANESWDDSTAATIASLEQQGPNYELIAVVVQYICHEHQAGSVLIFLPGLAEIKRLA